jgi:hypothetical protein
MEALFRHRYMDYVVECMSTMEKPSWDHENYPIDIHALLGKHERVFEPFPVGRPPDRGFEHVIELEEWDKPMITTPYRNLKRFKEEIEKAIK